MGAGVTPAAENIMKHTSNTLERGFVLGFVMATCASVAVLGCGPDDNGGTTSSSSSGSGGGGGGGAGSCLDPSTHADVLSINDSGFCVVAAFDAEYDPNHFIGNITWGRHGGLLFTRAGMNGLITTTRFFAAPSATTGKLTGDSLDIQVGLPNGSFFGGSALDLPFFNWTLVSYTNPDPLVTGEIILIQGTSVVLRYPINGFYSAAAVGGGMDPLGRLVYSGLSPIFKNATSTNALYAADACGAIGNMPRLVSDGDMTCKDSFAIETFGSGSGPVAADLAGNVFTVMLGDMGQEARGYAADMVKRGTDAAMGTSLFTIPGFGGSLAAVAPDDTGSGVVVFQPSDPTTFEWLDAVAQRYAIEGGKVVAQGTVGPFMTSPTKNTQFNFTTDDQGRIWIAIKRSSDYAVLVVARKA